MYPIICAHKENYTVIKETKTQLSRICKKLTAYDGTTTSGTQPRNNMTTMGKVGTSDLMMIIR